MTEKSARSLPLPLVLGADENHEEAGGTNEAVMCESEKTLDAKRSSIGSFDSR